MKKFLHIGCGHLTKKSTIKYFDNDNWEEIRVDIDEKVKPDIVASMTDMKKILSNKYDAIFSSHSIEHIYTHEVDNVLKEFFRVLNEDGFLVITCPDMKAVAKLVVEDKLSETAYNSSAGPIKALDMIYGHGDSLKRGLKFMAHKTGFTRKSLMSVLIKSGFQSCMGFERPKLYDIWIIAKKNKMEETELSKFSRSVLGI